MRPSPLNWMTVWFGVMLFSCSVLASPQGASAKALCRVIAIEGSPMANGEKIRAGERLVNSAKIQTDSHSRVRIQLDATTEMTVAKDSEVWIPRIGVEEAEIDAVDLRSGEILIRSTGGVEATVMMTPVSRQKLSEVEAWISYRPKEASLRAQVISGQLVFGGLEHEESQTLVAQQAGEFRAEILAGEVRFDEVLHGRRIVRGRLLPVSTKSGAEIAELKKDFEKVRPRPPTRKQVLQEQKMVCRNPRAQFNQCVWRCEARSGPRGGNKAGGGRAVCDSCIRLRCFADGQWGDSTRLAPATLDCPAGGRVGPCDY